MRFLNHFVLAIWLGATSLSGTAHDGHDHSTSAPTPSAPATPRTEARSKLFELVAVQDGDMLRIYVDRAATNEPVAGAQVAANGVGDPVQAEEIEPATYSVSLTELASPGEHALVFEIIAGDDGDLLQAKLETAGTIATRPADAMGWQTKAGGIAALAAALALGLVWLRRRRSLR